MKSQYVFIGFIVLFWVSFLTRMLWEGAFARRSESELERLKFFSARCDEAYNRCLKAYADGDLEEFNSAADQYKVLHARFNGEKAGRWGK